MNDHIHRLHGVTRAIVLTVTAASLVAGCGSDSQSGGTTASPASTAIKVSSIWARTSPAVAGAGALYLTVDNSSGVDDALVGVHVDPSIAKTAELHETVAVDASASTGMTAGTGGAPMMEMRPVDRIVVPAHGSVALAPGGYHIMMLDLAAPLTVGKTLDVTLTFETAGDKVVTADVRDTAP